MSLIPAEQNEIRTQSEGLQGESAVGEVPLVSIITVCFNAERYIEGAIKSVIEQTYKRIEYIIVDGGSTDGTLNILTRYKENIACLVSEPDKGIYDAMNKGIRLAHGSLIGILSSDDAFVNDAVEAVVCQWLKYKSQGVICGNSILINHRTGETHRVGPILDYQATKAILPHVACFVASWCYRDYGLYNPAYRISADADFFLRLLTNKVPITTIEKDIAYWRSGGESSSATLSAVWEAYRIQQRYIGTFKASCDLVRNFLVHYVRTVLSLQLRFILGDILVDRLLSCMKRVKRYV